MAYIYSIIREDIPLADQIVQTAHSAFHAGNENPALDGVIPSLILLELSNKLFEKGIFHRMFFEPDDDFGYTSLTTTLVEGDARKAFSNLRLWRA
jgi:hypothetical protein